MCIFKRIIIVIVFLIKNEYFTKITCVIVVFMQHFTLKCENSSKIDENQANYCNFTLNCNYNLLITKGKNNEKYI